MSEHLAKSTAEGVSTLPQQNMCQLYIDFYKYCVDLQLEILLDSGSFHYLWQAKINFCAEVQTDCAV